MQSIHFEEFSARFEGKVDRTGGPDSCHIWKGTRNSQGYGHFKFRGVTRIASRVAWEISIGLIPAGLSVCHTCDNRACVNPRHLWLGTTLQNQRDKLRKGRLRKPFSRHPRGYVKMPIPKKSLQQRLDEKLKVSSDGCWEWQGNIGTQGYGTIINKGKKHMVHRLVYETVHESIPSGFHVHHECRNKRCANPSHLRLVHQTEHWSISDGCCAKNAIKEHCPHGHPYDESNTYKGPDGFRECRQCNRDRSWKVWRKEHPQAIAQSERTHCPRGHPYDVQNTYVKPDGSRVCCECRKMFLQAWYKKRHPEAGVAFAERTHCPHGHPYDEENTYTRPDGKSRVCRSCARIARIAKKANSVQNG